MSLLAACGGGSDNGNNGDSGGDDGGDDGGEIATKTYNYPRSILGFPRYTLQIPSSALDPFVGEADPKLFEFRDKDLGYTIVIKEKKSDRVEGDAVFIEELPGSTDDCQYSETGSRTAPSGEWRQFEFQCTAAAGTDQGVAAEAVIGDYNTAIMIYSKSESGAQFLDGLVDTFAIVEE